MEQPFIIFGILCFALAGAAILVQGKSLRDVFGIERGMIWSLRDTALVTIASISAAWSVLFLLSWRDSFDLKVGLASLMLAVIACTISSNRIALYPVPLAFVAVEAWLAAVFSRHSIQWAVIAGVSSLLLLIYLKIWGNFPTRSR